MKITKAKDIHVYYWCPRCKEFIEIHLCNTIAPLFNLGKHIDSRSCPNCKCLLCIAKVSFIPDGGPI